MKELTPEFLHQVEAGAIILILIVVLLWPRKKKATEISSSFAYLKAAIKCSENKKQLGFYKTRAEHFFDQYYNKVSQKVLQRYYARLLESITIKETELDETATKAPSKV